MQNDTLKYELSLAAYGRRAADHPATVALIALGLAYWHERHSRTFLTSPGESVYRMLCAAAKLQDCGDRTDLSRPLPTAE